MWQSMVEDAEAAKALKLEKIAQETAEREQRYKKLEELVVKSSVYSKFLLEQIRKQKEGFEE